MASQGKQCQTEPMKEEETMFQAETTALKNGQIFKICKQ